MERFTFLNSKVIGAAIIAMSLTIKGELNLELIGFVIQLSAILCESVRLIIQGVLLKGKKLDPLSYVMLSSPVCGVILFIALLVVKIVPDEPADLALPLWSEVMYWAPW